jgi:hypothetical protein
MKKLAFLFLSVALLSACNNDEYVTDNAELSINAYIGNQQSTRAEKSAWVENDQLGVFVCNGTIDKPYLNNSERYVNVLFRHNGNGFVAEKIYLDENPAEVFAYYPYSANSIMGSAIPVESSTQTDYLYGHADTPASISQKNVNIEMKHALSQVVFRIKKSSEYTEGPGSLTALKIENNDASNVFRTTGTLNLSTGQISGTSNMGILTLMPGKTLNLTADYQSVSAICLPTGSSPGQNIRAVFTIDGRNFKYVFPAGTTWGAALRNIYTLTILNSGVEIGGGGNGNGNDDGITIEPWGDNSDSDISLVPIL